MWKTTDEIKQFLEPQERFDRLAAFAYRRFGPHLLDLAYPNPYVGPDEQVLKALELSVRDEKEPCFQYTPYGGKTLTRRLIAAKAGEEYGVPFNYRDIVLTPGAMAALNIVFRALFEPEDEVVVLTPCWFDYPLYLSHLQIPFRFVGQCPDKRLDLFAIEKALNSKTRGVILSHPGCPTGVLYSKEEIQDLSELLSRAEEHFRTKIFLISDEAHRHVIWSGKPFFSPLSFYPRCMTIYSFGKALFLQGQRIGYAAVSPQMPERLEIRTRLERCVRMMGFCGPTTLMQRAVRRLLDYRPCLEGIERCQREVRTALGKYGYDVCPGDATFFVYVRSPIPDDFEFVERLAAHGVLCIPSTLFHEPGYFRLSVTAHPESVKAGLSIFEKVIHSFEHPILHGGSIDG